MNILQNPITTLQHSWNNFQTGNHLLWDKTKELGFSGILRAAFKDLFLGMTVLQALYLIVLSATPLIIELVANGKVTDWTGMLASITGVACVVYVSMGRAANYLFGLINSLIYLVLSINATFYGEVVTTIFFVVMQPVGLWIWLVNALKANEEKDETVGDVTIRSLNLMGWIKWLAFTALIWASFGKAYETIGAARPYRDSVTDGTNWTGQLLMNGLYWEQWLFWIATNLFSIYLWWGTNFQIQGMYWVYTLNSIVGMVTWFKNAKKGV